VDTKAEEKD